MFVAIDPTSKLAFIKLEEKAKTGHGINEPGSPDRSRFLQDPHSANPQRHSSHIPAALQGGSQHTLHDPNVRHWLRGKRVPTKAHKTEPSVE